MKKRVRLLTEFKLSEISIVDHPAVAHAKFANVITLAKRADLSLREVIHKLFGTTQNKETIPVMDKPFSEFYKAHRALKKEIMFPVPGRSMSPSYTVSPTVNRQPELSVPASSVETPLSADDAMKAMRSVMSLNGSGDWRKAAAIAAQGMRKAVISVRPSDGVTRAPSGPSGNQKPLDADVHGHHRSPDGGADPSFMRPAR